MIVDFSYKKSGLSVTFRDLSSEVPASSTYSWDFDDLTENSTEKSPTHEFSSDGFYSVKLTITPPLGQGETKSRKISIGVSDKVLTVLPMSIYQMIMNYIPDILKPYITDNDIHNSMEKWQLYIQPLVIHDVALEDYNDQFAYEALENQLIVELAVYDMYTNVIINMLASATTIISDETHESESGGGDPIEPTAQKIKSIITGPTEVHYYEGLDGASTSSLAKTITGAFQPGGTVDTLLKNICMLANRVQVFLPLCDVINRTTVPKVVNKRVPGLLGGPNPTFPVKR